MRQKNITVFICSILLLAAVAFTIVAYCKNCDKDNLIEYLWDTIIPVITLSLGYLFGKEKNRISKQMLYIINGFDYFCVRMAIRIVGISNI